MLDPAFILKQLSEIEYNMAYMKSRCDDWTSIVREASYQISMPDSRLREAFLDRLEGFAEHADELKTALYTLRKHFKEDNQCPA